MLDTNYIKPIPKYILTAIYKKDKSFYPTPTGMNRFYAYLAVWHKELVKITVAVKHYKKQRYAVFVANTSVFGLVIKPIILSLQTYIHTLNKIKNYKLKK